jgi:hypothetical protein
MLLLVKTALMLCGAVVCAALVVGSVAGDGVELWRGAGLYALVVLAFPGVHRVRGVARLGRSAEVAGPLVAGELGELSPC